MEWYICFCLSLAVFISAIIWSVSLSRFKHKRGRIIDAPKVLFVGIVLSSVLVFFPIYYNEFRGNIGSFIETLMLSLHNTIRLFAIDSDFSIIGDNIGFLDQWFKASYTILSLILFIAAPLFTFGFVLSFFKNLSSYKKYIFKYNCDVYIFSKLNERSLALAQSLVSNNNKRVIVFAGVNRDNNVNIDELIDNAYVIGAICFKKEINSINFNRFHSKHKEMIFFICGDNDSENIEESLTLISNYRDRNNTSIYVFSNSIECELTINNTDVGCLKVRRIDEIRSLIYRNLYDSGFEIFNNAYKTEDNSKKITAVIIGMGRYGTEMLKALSWFCQMDGYIAEINVFDKAENAESVFESLCPELMDEKHNGNFGVEGEAKYKIQFYPGMDIKSSDFDNCIFSLRNVTYVFVALGDDELNISASIKLRSIFERIGVHPRIQAVVYSSKKKKTLDGISNFKNQKYDIEFIGDLETSYSEDVILGSDVEEAALERHKKWGAEEDFWLYEYTMLKKVLDTAGLGYVKIFNIVTFTNPRIDVENKYYRLKVCGSNYLPTYIDKFQSDNWYSDENIGTMVTAVEDAKCKEPFQMPVNMDDFKLNFATLMATLECSKEEKTADAEIDEVQAKVSPQAKNDENETVHIFRPSKFRRGVVAASVGIAVLNIAAFGINALLKSTR